MNTFNKKYKKLNVAYNKQLSKLTKDLGSGLENLNNYVILKLRLMRDQLILGAPSSEILVQNPVVTLIFKALKSYEMYSTCADRYVSKLKTLSKSSDSDAQRKEAVEVFKKEKELYWQTFCQVIRLINDAWVTVDAAV